MAVIATGVNKKLAFKRQAAKGDQTVKTGGQYLRRVTSSLDLNKATYQSNEIRPSQQVSDFRHGVRTVGGTINGELSVGSYQSFMESMCRQNVQTAITATGSAGDIDATAVSGARGTLDTTGGNFVTDGFKPGMVIRASGFTEASLNGCNLLIISMLADGTQMSVLRLDGADFVGSVEANAVTLTEAGKHTFIPQSGQTRDYYMIEHFFEDIGQSELFRDCVVSQMDVDLPASGMATVNFNVMGLGMDTATSEQLTTPSDASSTPILAAANGALIVNGVPMALITGMNFSLAGGYTTIGGVVGSNEEPDVFPGTIAVSGQATVLFQDASVRDMFLNETEVTIIGVFTTNNEADADFTSFTFPRVKFGGAAKDDGNKGLVMTMPFTALENVADNHNGLQTTVMIQDSQFA